MSKCVCSLSSESGSSVSGVLSLSQTSMDAPTIITGEIKGLAPGQHGISLHTYGDINLAKENNPIYHPFGSAPHGLPSDGDGNHKMGSLGNITTTEGGVTTVELSSSTVKLFGPHSVIGRLVAIYAAQDDGGRGGHDNSLTTGNAGPRVAAGVVGLSK